jgi:hypothetical protein
MLLISAVGVVLTYAFVQWEKKSNFPMLPIDFFKFNGFSLGLIAIMLASFVMFSFMFTQMLHFQLVRGHTALEAAVRFLPLPMGLMPAAANSDKLVSKFGSNNVISLGLVLMTVAMAIFTTVEIDSEYIRLAGIFLLLGFGMGLTLAPATTVVMDSIPEDKVGVGSATNDASREVGGALGIAIGGSVLNEYYQKNMVVPEGLELGSIPLESFPAAMQIGGDLLANGNALGGVLIQNAQLAFMEGMVASAAVMGVIAIVNAILVKLYMPGRIISNIVQ